MKIIERAREIIFNPRMAWQTIKEEQLDIKQLFINYAAPLALIPSVCGLVGMTIIGIHLLDGNVIRAPFLEAFFGGAAGYGLNLTAIFIAGWVVKLLAPVFGAKADLDSAVKVVVFSMTPVWLAGLFSLIPGMGILSILGLYGIYLLYLGLKEVLATPQNKAVLYTISVLLAGVFISFILSLIVVSTIYGPMFMRMLAA
ncbi:MAG: YIP1 family protein [Candidatus Margulisbacteria bacterium]|nr:YIP1 family protein [Candidatus Margulisiibacteriota bacterium]